MNSGVGLSWRFAVRLLMSALTVWAVVVQHRLWTSGEVATSEWIPFALAIVGFMAQIWTRWWVPGVGAVLIGYAGLLVFPGTFNSGLWFVLLPFCVDVNSRRPAWPGWCAMVVLTVGSIVDWVGDPGSSVVLVVYLWSLSLLGMFLRGQEESKRQLRELHALQRRAEQQALAVNMHDSVAATLTQAVAVIRAARIRGPLGEENRSSLNIVEENVTTALDELRVIVRLLDDDESARPAKQEPLALGLARARETLEEAGYLASLKATGDWSAPQESDETAHLVLGEAVANVLRYALPGGPVHISADRSARRLTLAVISQLAPSPVVVRDAGGLGLRSLAARVDAEGGAFDAGADEGAWVVRMELPIGRPQSA